jgi:hypothetical protein
MDENLCKKLNGVMEKSFSGNKTICSFDGDEPLDVRTLSGEEKISLLENALDAHSYFSVKSETNKSGKFLVDVQTANAIIAVDKALSGTNKEKYRSFPIERMGYTAWKLLK